MKTATVISCAAALTVVAVGGLSAFAWQPANQGPDLVGGLKGTKGCLGVETARLSSGKNVIFAWFSFRACG